MMKRFISLILILLFVLSCLPVLATKTPAKQVTIINCDTGRKITAADGSTSFTMEDNDNGTTFKDAVGDYLDLSGAQPTSVSHAVNYTVTELTMGRTHIQLANGNYIYDSDEGADNAATLANSNDGALINTAWFITDADAQQPLKVLTIGDSLTYGVDLELSGTTKPRVAYRQTLSQNLIDYFGKVAFVGNVDEYTTTITDPYLYRHSGYSGYVIEDVYHIEKHPGVKPMVDDMMAKYQPDIVIMMLGTNDLGLAVMTSEIIPRWEDFALQIESQLPEDGLLICSSLPPSNNSTKDTAFNEKIQARTRELANEGYKVGFADPYTPLSENASTYLNSDGVHFNSLGYNVIGQVFTEAITTAYTANREKVMPNPLIPADPYAEPKEESNIPDTNEGLGASLSPMILVLIGIGVAMIVTVIVLIILLKKKNK